MTVALSCMRCGADLRPTANFCDECGSQTAAPGTTAEYKQVTVLFADVVGSMDIAAAVGAERLREIMTEPVARAAAVVQRYGGTVDKFTGDGIMAVVGAPAAMEDHAVRACLAALGIQEEVAHLAAAVKPRDGVDLELRVGLNSGQVIAGEIGSAALGYTAIGEQVGMAQRMESVAERGAVMLSAFTARLVEGAAMLGEPQLVQIKGADQPLPHGGCSALPLSRRMSRVRHWWAASGNWPRWPRCWIARRLMRMRALLARARGDAAAYADFRDRYREMANSLGFEGHSEWAEALP